MLYCAKFYGRCFIRVYEDKMPVIKLCTVQHYPIIAQDTLKFVFGDGQKWGKMGKKVYEKKGKQSFYFQNRKNSYFCPSCAEIWIWGWEKM